MISNRYISIALGVVALALSGACVPNTIEDPEYGLMIEEPAEAEGDPATAIVGPFDQLTVCPVAMATCDGKAANRCGEARNCGACGRTCQSGALCREARCMRGTRRDGGPSDASRDTSPDRPRDTSPDRPKDSRG